MAKKGKRKQPPPHCGRQLNTVARQRWNVIFCPSRRDYFSILHGSLRTGNAPPSPLDTPTKLQKITFDASLPQNSDGRLIGNYLKIKIFFPAADFYNYVELTPRKRQRGRYRGVKCVMCGRQIRRFLGYQNEYSFTIAACLRPIAELDCHSGENT
jgi:hypothetical protein